MENVYVFYITSTCIHGEELLRQFTFHQKYRRSHNETDVRHIWEIDIRTIRRDLWSEYNQLGRFFMEVSIFGWWRWSHLSLAHKCLRIFRLCIRLLGRWTRTHNQIMHGKTDWRGSKVHQNTEPLDKINGEPLEFQWNIYPGFTTLQFCPWSPRVTVKVERRTRQFHWTNYLYVDVQRHLMEIQRQLSTMLANSFLYLQEDSEQENGHFLGFVQRKNGTLLVKTVHKEDGTKLQRKWCWNLQKADTQSSEPRVHCPDECLKAKVVEKLSIHYCTEFGTIETVLRTIISVNQLSLYGEVAETCEEYESCPDRTERPVVRWQSSPSFVPSVIKTNILSTDDLAQEEDLLQRYQERIEKLSQQDRVIKFCIDAGFLTTVDVGQYFMTKKTLKISHNLQSQWHVVSIRYHDIKNQLTRKVGFEKTPKLSPCQKSQPVTCKENMEWKLELNL